MNHYEGCITNDDPSTVFVFGSNPIGINGNRERGTGGAALIAVEQFGVGYRERMDNRLSSSGQSYGLVTVLYPGKKRSITINQITDNIVELFRCCVQHPEKNFMVAYRNTKTKSLNGYYGYEMMIAFVNAWKKFGHVWPSNLYISKEWNDYISSRCEVVYGDIGEKTIVETRFWEQVENYKSPCKLF